MTRILLGVLFYTLASSVVIANSNTAVVSVYVFQQGVPVSNADVLSNGELIGFTNKLGAFHVQLAEGWHELVVNHQGLEIKKLNLKLVADERMRIILAQPSAEYPAATDIESSEGTKIIGENKGSQKLALSETGVLKGTVKSHQGNTPVPGVRVFISGISGAIKTDGDGNYTIKVPVGEYSVSFVHPDFSTQIFKSITVNTNTSTTRSAQLTPVGEELGEFVVNAPSIEGGFKALADEKRKSSSVKDVIGAKQMSNAGASDAAGALKRVTGLTLVDGKYIFVRGLGERYSSTLLNGANLPSPDPTRRVVPLDLFPTGVLSGIVIQKTYSPDMPGDFSGGVVQLRTLGEIPEEPESSISIELKYNSNTTFKEGLGYEGGSTDFIGFDDGSRSLPGLVDAETNGGVKPGELSEAAAESFPQIYNVTPSTLPPGFKLKMLFSDVFEPLDSDYGWGYNIALNYENNWDLREEIRNTYSGDGKGGVVLENQINRTRTENEINLGGLLNFIFEAGESHRYESNTILTRQTTDTVVREEGFLSENEINVRDTTLEWRETQLFSQQFRGSHQYAALNDLELDWYATLSQATRDVPFSRYYRYVENNGAYLLTRDNVHQIRYEALTDNTADFALNLSYPLYDLFGTFTKIKLGVSSLNKDRESQILRFTWLTPDNIDTEILRDENPDNIFTNANIGEDGYRLFNGTQPTDNYIAEQSIMAMYLMADVIVNDEWSFMAGARVEDNEQIVTTFELANPDEAVVGKIVSQDVLPAASLIWAFNDSMNKNMQLRAAASATVNRPDFKELSSAPYIDPITRDVIIGNPNLQQSDVTNLDLRWEWYVTHFEGMSASLFYKDFVSPIEKTKLPGGGDSDVFSFVNAEGATNAGIELEGRAWLSRFFGGSLRGIYVESNLSLIDSTVRLGDNAGQLTSTSRPLQGQAPWIVNLILGYENLVSQSKATLLFNMSGEYIVNVGTQGIPDAYAQPIPTLDFVYKKSFFRGREDNLHLSLKVQNILNPDIEVLRGGELERSYNKGVSVSAQLKYSWK